ncbi:MAG TPA: MauE/DoxX family redox-associated membrane protein [Ilumatobacter sp.]|nr:MauE/DoxX family redox-associated membrane protein [Ilumatobacter sp.]
MNAVSLVASLLLGATFVVAGAAKIAAGPMWPVHVADLGAPKIAGPVLPWAELLIGAALMAQLFEPFAAWAAIALTVAFTALIARRLSQGRRPACACFGAWSAKPLGPGHLARNAAMLVLGVLSLTG